MATDFHARVRELLEAALERSPQTRTAFLRRMTAGDSTLLGEALSLLPYYAGPAGGSAAGAAPALLPGTTTFTRLVAAAEGEPVWEPPFSIAPYTVVELLGRGGMGVVYRAINPLSGGEVAIKLLRGRFHSARSRWRFKHEEELLRQLRHPGIVRFLHGGTATLVRQVDGQTVLDQHPYFVMEFVRGQTLLEHAARQALGVLARVALLAEVCAAAEYAHQRGVIHRDLKPQNILVDEAGRPRILDFGIARLQSIGPESDPDRNRFLGTLAYASPEQRAGGDVALTPASDVYTLGLILHELLTGRLPEWRRGRLVIDLRNVDVPAGARADATVAAQLRYALHAIVAAALRKTRGQRYAHAGELGQDLAEVVRVFTPCGRWQALVQGLDRLLRPVSAAPGRTHDRLLAAVLRRRIGLAMDNDAAPPPPGGAEEP